MLETQNEALSQYPLCNLFALCRAEALELVHSFHSSAKQFRICRCFAARCCRLARCW